MDMDMDVDMEDEPQMKIVKNYQRPDVRWGGWMQEGLQLWLRCQGALLGERSRPPATDQAKRLHMSKAYATCGVCL